MPARRHHYLPQFYLEGFADSNGKVWQYDKESLSPMGLYPDSIAVRPNLYRLTNADGTPDPNTLEQAFSQVEGNFATLKRKLGENPNLDEGDLPTFLNFAVLMKARVPALVDYIRSKMQEVQRISLSMLAQHKEAFDVQWDEMREEILKAGGPDIAQVEREEVRQSFEPEHDRQ